MMKDLFANNEVNTGRQVEFDYSKGLFFLAILFIHAFQAAGGGAGADEVAYKISYMILTMTGAPIFLFVMGLGTRYREVSVGDMFRAGGRLVSYQYLNNIAIVASIVLPYFIMRNFIDMSVHKEQVSFLSELLALYINIFFLAGGIYLVIAFLKLVKTPIWLYVVLGLLINIFSPSLIGLSVGIVPVDYFLGGIFGGTVYSSFSVLNYLPYTFFGIAFGELLKRVNPEAKKRFYLICCSVGALLFSLFLILTFMKYSDFDSLYQYISTTYSQPDFMRTIANTSGVIMLAGVLYFLSGMIAKCGFINRALLYYSKHISKYYAVHFTLLFLVYGFNGYKPFGFWGCVVLFLFSIPYCDLVVRTYNRLITAQ